MALLFGVRLCGLGRTAMGVRESEACQIYSLSPLPAISIFVVFVSVQKYLISEVGSHIHLSQHLF